jgi:formylglycine-generating enzyme required for sulfatase activity
MNQVAANFTIDRTTQVVHTFTEDLGEGILLDMVLIPPGEFQMGSPTDELEHRAAEEPQHLVKIDNPFFMGQYPITQAQWRLVAQLPKIEQELDPDPSHFKGDDLPVESVSWLDAQEFCARLSVVTKRDYRLPSEAEWEYVCRAGTTTPFHFGETIDAELANYQAEDEKIGDTIYPGKYGRGKFGEYRRQTTPVGSFGVANDFGLFDLHGNVWEWCEDHYHENYEGAPTNGISWLDLDASEDAFRVLRGGSWGYDPRNCRSACRNGSYAGHRIGNLGFRVVYSPARILP